MSEADQHIISCLHVLKQALIIVRLQKALGAGAGHSQVLYGKFRKIPIELGAPAIAGIVVGGVIKLGSCGIANDPEGGKSGF